MSSAPLTEQELSHYRSYIGRRLVETDSVAPEVIGRIAAALDEPWAGGDAALPPLWHYGLFLPDTPTAALGPDGHPPRGAFMPDVRLPRRMFAGSDMRFLAPLRAAVPALRTSEVSAVDLRRGKSGELVFVKVKSEVVQRDTLCIEEEQTIVYRDAGASVPAVVPLPERAAAAPGDWLPTSVELFRYSAVSFNTHRIHYDLPYVTTVEGYPGLVVQGPLIATRLAALAAKTAGALLSFRFRAEAPLFVGQPVRLTATIEGRDCRVAAQRCDGVTAMTAVATF